ncbi:peptidoglycan-associated lipoprotein Pal [Bartonella ancashensis]|uniref:Peptidoglycan-associated lipoprotein n=1 Tax=Bartonella ancashensis TaxID=1318743 RepID=A0A0M4M2J6_9HYPH|nr:peptidoglycan-associated lipoprotein Pal [Bartonella ancashensis]ALE03112.1 Outer membrane lipoprotein omp16 precursor [Bartonella ancashensis]
MRSVQKGIYPLSLVFLCLFAVAGCSRKGFNYNRDADLSMQGVGAGHNAQISRAMPGSVREFTVSVGDRVFFSLDSSSVEEEAKPILRRQAEWLLRYPHYRITIEGHADDRGTREYNLALGQSRAVSVRDYLISLGVSPRRMETISYGKERPVAVCDNASCWNQNRRAVIAISAVEGH